MKIIEKVNYQVGWFLSLLNHLGDNWHKLSSNCLDYNIKIHFTTQISFLSIITTWFTSLHNTWISFPDTSFLFIALIRFVIVYMHLFWVSLSILKFHRIFLFYFSLLYSAPRIIIIQPHNLMLHLSSIISIPVSHALFPMTSQIIWHFHILCKISSFAIFYHFIYSQKVSSFLKFFSLIYLKTLKVLIPFLIADTIISGLVCSGD